MEFIYITTTAFLLVGIVYLFWSQNKKSDKKPDAFMMLQNQLNELRNVLDNKLGESAKDMQESVKTQFRESQKLIRDITEQLIEVKKTNEQVFNMTDQLKNLEQVLKNQKQRGSLGEAGLELILSNILPPTAYKMQYQFEDGTMVDAAIFVKDIIIPVDAKFSLDNYMRIINEKDDERRKILEKEFVNDLKKRIDETAKYIKPREGTAPFAFMYIPAEAIYYDLLVNEVGAVAINTRNLIEYAQKDRKVMIISPNTFTAYLQTVLQGLRAAEIEKNTERIIKQIQALTHHVGSYQEYMTKLGNSLSTTVNHYNRSFKELKKIDKDVARITQGESSLEPVAIDGPRMDDE